MWTQIGKLGISWAKTLCLIRLKVAKVEGPNMMKWVFLLHTKKSSGKVTWKNTWIYLNRSDKLFSPEQHLKAPEIYLKFTWKIQASLAELLPEHAWKTPEKNAWTVQAKILFQVFLPEFYLNFSGKNAWKIQVKFR